MTEKKSTTKKRAPAKATAPVQPAPAEPEVIPPATTPEAPAAASEGELVVHQDTQPAAAESEHDTALSIVGGVTTEQLKQALVVQTEQRKLIQDFIGENLQEGTDYGKIHVVKNCQAEERQRGSCDKDYHFSKSILFKPGQEKIFSLFGINDKLEKDEEAYAMLNVPGLVAYKCTMTRNGKYIGEGRGAATLSGTQNDPNSTIKKAEKRARMDACLSLGFSAYFTQDLDDPEYASQREMMNSKAAAEAERRDKDEFGLLPRNPDLPIDNNERATLHRILLKNGFSDPDEILELLRLNGVSDPKAMTSAQARDMMGKIAHSMFAAPAPKPKDVVVEPTDGPIDFPDDIDQRPADERPAVQEEELVVDDDLKENIIDQFNSLTLNARGEMWFKKYATGRPYGGFEKFSDADWRKAFVLIQDILDGRVMPDSDHLRASDEPTPTRNYSEPTREQLDLGDTPAPAPVHHSDPGDVAR